MSTLTAGVRWSFRITDDGLSFRCNNCENFCTSRFSPDVGTILGLLNWHHADVHGPVEHRPGTPVVSSKPPIPGNVNAPYPRIPVDQSKGGEFHRLRPLAEFAAIGWALSDEGPWNVSMSPAEAIGRQVTEALLYLLEMGLVDIDADRLETFLANPHPPYREGR